MMHITDDPDREQPIPLGRYSIGRHSEIYVFEKGEFYYAQLRTNKKFMKGWRSRSFVKLSWIIDGFSEGALYAQSVLI